MKKVLIIVLLMTCLLGLVGCDPGVYTIDREEILSNTTKIELLNYDNTNPEHISGKGKNVPVFDFSKATLIATLDESRFEDVVKDIEEHPFTVFDYSVMNEPIGKTMILYQSDGSMVVLFGRIYKNKYGISRHYGECHIYDENGAFVEYLGDIDGNYVDILEAKYFESST